MKIKPYPPITPSHFEKMCKEWAEVILMEESGTWIWPALNAPYRPIMQFQEDTSLQKKLFADVYQRQIFIHVDFKQITTLNKNEVYQILKDAFLAQTQELIDVKKPLLTILDTLSQQDKIINFFVTGVDGSIRKDNWEIVEKLNFLAERGFETHVLLFLETDITHSDYFSKFNKKTTLAQHINITPFYTTSDLETFIKYLCFNWQVKLNQEQEQFIFDNCGGHYLLSKDVVRQIRKQKNLSYQELYELPSLNLRIEAIVNNLSREQKAVINQVFNKEIIGKQLEHTRKFLFTQGWIKEESNTLVVTIPLLKRAILSSFPQHQTTDLLTYTQLEKKVIDFLKSKEQTLISREELAAVIWETAWEDNYSDWAIDQLMHRIREKLEQTNAPYKIITKKGEGFALLPLSS